MQRVCLLIISVAVVVLVGCRPPPASGPASELWFRWQFIGMEKLAADTNATTLGKIAALPASQELREATTRQLALALQKILQPATNPAPADCSALFQPLLDQAVRRGFIFEGHGRGDQPTAWLLAVLLQGDEARLWETNFLTAAKWLNLGEPKKLSTKSFGGWNLTQPDKRFIDYLELSKWVVVGTGTDRRPMIEALRKIESTEWPGPTSSNAWLAAEIAGHRLAGMFGRTNSTSWPRLELTVSGRKGDSFTEGRLRFAEPVAWQLPAWNVPTNFVRDPLISFTAARGFAPWLRGQPAFQQLALTNAPDQLFLWAQAQIPFQTFAAAPLPGATNALENLQLHLPAILRAPLTNFAAGINWNSNHTELVWQRLPILQPRLRAATTADGEFLVGGLFPERPKSAPMPAELRAHLERPRLIYYDWEITQERLTQWRQLLQIWQMVSLQPAPARVLASQGWVDAAAPFLGNTVTEISVKDERELTFVRKAPLGLTGFELMWFARELDAFIAPPTPRRRTSLPPAPPFSTQ